MEILEAGADPAAFLSRLKEGPRPVLLLDYDGTLSPFREARDRAVPYPGVRERIRRLLRQGRTRIVIVSGRAIRDLMPLLGVEPAPEIWGSHGWERSTPEGDIEVMEAPASAREHLTRGEELARERLPADRVEVKPVSVAVHVRGMEEAEARRLLERMDAAWHPLLDGCDLEVHPFDGGLELRVPGRDKGTAVREILGDEPPDAPVAYLGDDRTDEDAFRELKDRGLTVLVRAQGSDTAAKVRMEPPGELLQFLDDWHEAIRRRDD